MFKHHKLLFLPPWQERLSIVWVSVLCVAFLRCHFRFSYFALSTMMMHSTARVERIVTTVNDKTPLNDINAIYIIKWRCIINSCYKASQVDSQLIQTTELGMVKWGCCCTAWRGTDTILVKFHLFLFFIAYND